MPAATAAAENSIPATLATSSIRRSSVLSRSICRAISCCRLSGTLGLDAWPAHLAVPIVHQLNKHALCNQIVHRGDHEQRVAVRATVNHLAPRVVRGARPCAPTRQNRCSRYSATASSLNNPSGSSCTLPVQLQFLLDRLQRMLLHDHIHRAIGANHQQPAGSRRRASKASNPAWSTSLQCRSSSHSTSGRSAVMASSASPISRSIRSRVAPSSLRCKASSSAA